MLLCKHSHPITPLYTFNIHCIFQNCCFSFKSQKNKIFCSIDFLFDVFPINKKVYVAIGLKLLMELDLDLLELLYNIQKQLVILRSYFKHLAFIRVLLQKLNCPKSFWYQFAVSIIMCEHGVFRVSEEWFQRNPAQHQKHHSK